MTKILNVTTNVFLVGKILNPQLIHHFLYKLQFTH